MVPGCGTGAGPRRACPRFSSSAAADSLRPLFRWLGPGPLLERSAGAGATRVASSARRPEKVEACAALLPAARLCSASEGPTAAPSRAARSPDSSRATVDPLAFAPEADRGQYAGPVSCWNAPVPALSSARCGPAVRSTVGDLFRCHFHVFPINRQQGLGRPWSAGTRRRG